MALRGMLWLFVFCGATIAACEGQSVNAGSTHAALEGDVCSEEEIRDCYERNAGAAATVDKPAVPAVPLPMLETSLRSDPPRWLRSDGRRCAG
jgi:hypothetical protein